MPNIKSAKKRVKVTNSKNMQNKVFKSAMRTNLKKLNAGIEAKDAASLNEAYKIIDKAAAKGIMHKNTAANKKAKLAAQFNA
jgi:small subunit ribosomal protein S20